MNSRMQQALLTLELDAWNAGVERARREYEYRPITYGRPCACTICRRKGRCWR